MTSNEFAKLMTTLTREPDWSIAYKQILAEFESNDPRIYALIDHFFQLRPKTASEIRMLGYLLFCSVKILALDHLGYLKNYSLWRPAGLTERKATRQ